MMMLFVRYVGRRGRVLDVQRTVRYRTVPIPVHLTTLILFLKNNILL